MTALFGLVVIFLTAADCHFLIVRHELVFEVEGDFHAAVETFVDVEVEAGEEVEAEAVARFHTVDVVVAFDCAKR